MPRIILVAAIFLFTAITGPAFAEPGLTRIADNVYAYAGVQNGSPANSFGANAGIVVGRDGIVVIDTLVSAREARRFLADIRAVSDKPIRYVVNTHHHLDHAWGNSEFVKKGAVVIAQVNDKTMMETTGEDALKDAGRFGLSADDLAGTKISPPTLAFSDRMEIDLGDRKVLLIHLAPSHTAGSLLVYLPETKVLFAGDALFTEYHPFLAEGDLGGWAETLDFIEAMDAEKIVPGHGPVSDKGDVAAMRSYLTAFDAKARELATTSGDIDGIAAEIKKSLPPRSEGEFLIKANLGMRYLQGK